MCEINFLEPFYIFDTCLARLVPMIGQILLVSSSTVRTSGKPKHKHMQLWCHSNITVSHTLCYSVRAFCVKPIFLKKPFLMNHRPSAVQCSISSWSLSSQAVTNSNFICFISIWLDKKVEAASWLVPTPCSFTVVFPTPNKLKESIMNLTK